MDDYGYWRFLEDYEIFKADEKAKEDRLLWEKPDKAVDEEIDKLYAEKQREKRREEQREIRKRALEILKNGNPFDYIIKEHQKLHIGNVGVAKLLLLSIGCQLTKEIDGLQVSISGSPGKGKTHCCRSMLRLIFKENVLDTSLSDKVAFYDPDLKKEGTIIFIDDAEVSKDLNSTIKKAMDNFQNKTIPKRTLGINTIENSIPPRTVWWLTSVNEKYSEELLDRMFKIKIDESPEQDIRVNDHLKKIAKTGNKELLTTKEAEICRKIIGIIKSKKKLFKVIIPYSDNIKFNNTRDTRKNNMFFDILMAFSVFKYRQRETDDNGYLIAEKEDFNDAAEFHNKYGIVHHFKLTAQEIEMCEILQRDHNIPGRVYSDRYTIIDLANAMKLGVSRTRQIINRIEEEFDGLGVFKREPIDTWSKTQQFSLMNFDLKLGSLDYVSYVSPEKKEVVDKKVVDKNDFGNEDDFDDEDEVSVKSEENRRIIHSFK